jgi:hypothetical protein
MNPAVRARLSAAYGSGFRPEIEAARLRDQLAARVEEINTSTDPSERVGLHIEIQDLRRRIAEQEAR